MHFPQCWVNPLFTILFSIYNNSLLLRTSVTILTHFVWLTYKKNHLISAVNFGGLPIDNIIILKSLPDFSIQLHSVNSAILFYTFAQKSLITYHQQTLECQYQSLHSHCLLARNNISEEQSHSNHHWGQLSFDCFSKDLVKVPLLQVLLLATKQQYSKYDNDSVPSTKI